jgi:hydroxymethylbilane synthase
VIRIATRKSALALWQAERVQALLEQRGFECSLVPMTTEGDRIVDRPLAEVGGKGLFVKELERALLEERADVAVHSAKDVPFALPEGLVLSGFPAREDPRDALIAPGFGTFEKLPRGARVGTSSLRRATQLRAARPDLVVVPIRGNVPTRLGRAGRDGLDAVVLALAGVRRLGLEQHVTQVLPVELSLPAAGQGALAVEAVRGSAGDRAAAQLDDRATSLCVRAERAVLTRLAGDCTVPVAAYAVLEGESLWLRAALGVEDRIVRAESRGTDPERLGKSVGDSLMGTV